MKDWVKPLYIGYHQALQLPKNLFLFPRMGHLKISLGPIQFLYSKFYGLLKLTFHISTMAPNSSGVQSSYIASTSTKTLTNVKFHTAAALQFPTAFLHRLFLERDSFL